jgi:hypothetical protein
MDQRESWFTGAVGAVLVAGAVFFGVVMVPVYERMLGVCFEGLRIRRIWEKASSIAHIHQLRGAF